MLVSLERVAEVAETFGEFRRVPKLLASSAALKPSFDKPLIP